ncbi:MAG TPA: glycoside hydrolase family 3 C-terminal domain-containing protein, partial [Acidimicrobiales bacterium]|nr:glycoside hydrolase family 3 C-terminal domain-containing protein [Acidimicrobiales bacterium]
MAPDPAAVADQLTMEEACAVVAGVSMWRSAAVDRLGVPQVKVTDGPNGARGEFMGDDRTPAVVTPAGIALGASFDPHLVRRVGALLGREARRRSAHVLLAPAVNLHRTPVGGRTFEYLSEDPELTAALAVAYVQGVQSTGVAVTVKHLVCNDTEVDRLTVDVHVDERVLRELYLRPFEAAVRDGGAWGVMTAYNRLHGEFCAANRWLLDEVLRNEWGFDGVVVSDWYGAHDTVASAHAGLDLEMPGPPRIYGAALAAAVERRQVDADAVRRLARRVLELGDRTGAAERPAGEPERSVVDDTEVALCREAAVAGTVLVRNEGAALPLLGAMSLCVIGRAGGTPRVMGGGSAALRAVRSGSIVDALRDRGMRVRHAVGCDIDRHAPLPDADRVVGPDGEPGLVVTYHAGPGGDGPALATRRISTTHLQLFGSLPEGVPPGDWSVVVRGAFRCRHDGAHDVGAIVNGRPRVTVGGAVVVSGVDALPRSDEWNGTMSVEQLATVDGRAGGLLDIEVVWPRRSPFGTLRIGVREPVAGDPVDEAAAAAGGAEAAVVVVGTNDDWESEGHDRTSIALPGRQDELVRRVAAVNPRTVVVVNAGSPVAMPWADDVAAIVVGWFGGMEMADAVADVLVGAADPGGRLPTTFPRSLDDVPAWRWHDPVDGVQTYGEGFDVGYRAHDRTGVAPQWPFGHGLSYGSARWGDPHVSA